MMTKEKKRGFLENFKGEQWVLSIATFLLGGLLSFTGYSTKIGIVFSIAIGLTVWLFGFFVTLWSIKLTHLIKRVDLRLDKNDEVARQIANYIEDFIDIAAIEGDRKKRLKKRLNGVKQSFDYKGIEEKNLRKKVLKTLNKEWIQYIAVSIFGPGEWTDPHWFSYLSLQIARAAELKPKGITAKRYFIYRQELIDEYTEELKLLIECHGNYVEVFLFSLEAVEKKLKNRGVELQDVAFVTEPNGCKSLIWRNPEREGGAEVTTKSQYVKPVEKLVEQLATLEGDYDIKDVVCD